MNFALLDYWILDLAHPETNLILSCGDVRSLNSDKVF